VFGPGFTLCIVNSGDSLRVFLESTVSAETLSKFYGVRRAGYEELLKVFGSGAWAGEARLKREFDFYHTDVVVSDLPGLVNSLESKGGVCVSASRDPGLKMVFASKASSLLSKASKYHNESFRLQGKELQKRMGKILLGRILVLAPSKSELKIIGKLVEASCNAPLKWEKRRVRELDDLVELLRPPQTGFWWRLFGERNLIVFTEDLLPEIVKLPDPSLHRIGFARGSPLPMVIPVRSGEKTFRIGVLEDGREFRLSLEDLYRHCYVIGQTGSGKTTFIKMLVHRLRELGNAAIVVVDPHGDMALELAEEIPEALYLHPIKSPFGLNPLDLPKHESRDFAVTIAIDILIEMFKEVLKLMETAVNVKYLLQVLLRAFYSKTDSPTLAMLYNAILGLYKGELDLDVDEEEWQRQLEALQSMQDQTFISALSRLEAYAHDKLLLKLTSRTTIDFEKKLSPGSTTIFSLSKADLGESLARLIASTIVMKLWFEVLARARLSKPRSPVFLVIDEFQFVADLPIIDTILSEARKYGLHLVIAHQHTKQIPEQLLQSVMSNCAVKVAFQVGGGDIKKLSVMDASFADSLEKALTGLTIGKAVVKLTARPGEQQPPPVVVQMDYVKHEVRRGDVYTKAFDPGEPGSQDLKSLLNPVLKYIEPAKPLEFHALYTLKTSGPLALADLATRLGARREDVEEVVNSLAGRGFVEVYREGNKKIVKYVKGLYRGLRKVAPSEEGYMLAKKVLLYYARRGYVVAPVRQDPDLSSRPDLVAVPVDKSTWRPVYSKAVAVEVESCNEVETHPEQVSHNWVKESVRDFAEVHTWTWDTCFEKLKLVYGKAGVDGAKVKVFSARRTPGRQTGEKTAGTGGMARQAQAPPEEAGEALVEESSTRRGSSVETEEVAGEEGGPLVEHVGGSEAGGKPSETASQLQQDLAPIPGAQAAGGGGPAGPSQLERVFTASDGRRYRAVLAGERELNMFDKVCREGSAITVDLKGGVIECKPRGYTMRFRVKASSLEALG
jgi:DNA helicase HerA-like ATPase